MTGSPMYVIVTKDATITDLDVIWGVVPEGDVVFFLNTLERENADVVFNVVQFELASKRKKATA